MKDFRIKLSVLNRCIGSAFGTQMASIDYVNEYDEVVIEVDYHVTRAVDLARAEEYVRRFGAKKVDFVWPQKEN